MKTKVLLLLSALLSLGFAFSIPVYAQGPTPTPTLTEQETLNLAEQVAEDAVSASRNALGVVTNANSAVNTSNNALAIAIEAYIVGAVLVILIVTLAFRSGLQSFRQARRDLAQARLRIADMRANLKTNTDQVHRQAEQAIRSLSATQLGQQQLELSNVRGAIQMYEKAFALDPNNRATHYFLGELYIQERQFDAGIGHLQALFASDFNYAPAEAALGLALYLQGDQVNQPTERALLYVQAEERLLQALQADSTAMNLGGTSVQAMLGGLYKRQGRIDQAIARYEAARNSTPQSTTPIANLAVLYFMKGNWQAARPYFEQIKRSSAETLIQNPRDQGAHADHLKAAVALGDDVAITHDLEFIEQHTGTANELAALLDDLNRLRHSPQPPPSIDEVIVRLEKAVKTIKVP